MEIKKKEINGILKKIYFNPCQNKIIDIMIITIINNRQFNSNYKTI